MRASLLKSPEKVVALTTRADSGCHEVPRSCRRDRYSGGPGYRLDPPAGGLGIRRARPEQRPVDS